MLPQWSRCRRGWIPRACGWPRTPPASATGSASGPTWPSGSGARCARTTRPTAPPGTTSPTTTPAAGPTAGARTACSGFCDRQGRLCFALALWNGQDPILKERLFGLTGPEGNHGEDVKELYYYLDSTPTHSYCKALYKYPQRPFPYDELVAENRRRGRQPEYELLDTGVFDGDRYFDVFVEYAKAGPEDMLIQITVANRGDRGRRPASAAHVVVPQHVVLGPAGRRLRRRGRGWPRWPPTPSPPATRAWARFVLRAQRRRALAVHRERDQPPAAVRRGQRVAVREGRVSRLRGPGPAGPGEPGRRGHQGGGAVPAGGAGRRPDWCVRLRLDRRWGAADLRRRRLRGGAGPAQARGRPVLRPRCPALLSRREEIGASCARATPGLLWSKQFYHYDVRAWLEGDPAQPPPPGRRARRRATPSGGTCTTATSSRCRTSGSTRGTRPGIWRST